MARPSAEAISPAVQQAMRDAHLLLLPDTVTPEAVDVLLRQRVDDSRLLEVGRARLGRRSSISGPFRLDDDTALAVHVPGPWNLAYVVQAPIERDVAAFGDIADPVQRAWWMRLFADGKPFREEGDAVDLALALARRLGGALRIGRRPVLVQPAASRLLDLTVWSPSWVGPGRLLAAVARTLPGAAVDLGGAAWAGPAEPSPDDEPLDVGQLDVLHASDDRLRLAAAVVGAVNDGRALAAPDVVDGYEVLADDDLRVAVTYEDHVPPWVRRRLADRTPDAGPLVTLTVGWLPADVIRLESEQPPFTFQRSRELVRPRVRATARVLAELTHGVVTDADGFEVDRYSLR